MARSTRKARKEENEQSEPIPSGDATRNGDSVPEWALNALLEDVPEAAILNTTTIDRGRFRGSVLANTTRGAAFVTKTSVGEPYVFFLPPPGRVIRFSCGRCAEHVEAYNPSLPRVIHCGNCAAGHHVDTTGRVEPLQVEASQAPTATKTRAQATPEPRPAQGEEDYEPQCQAVTPEGAQCRNSSRHGSRYCGSHRNYSPPRGAKARSAKDTKPRVEGAPDTPPFSR